MRKARCPGCYAEITVPETVHVTTCPYCGLTFRISETGAERVDIDHFYFPLDRRDPYDLLMRFVERQYGAPSDIRANSTLVQRILHYIPVYFYYLHGIAEVERADGRGVKVEEVDYIGIPASGSELDELLKDYPFPIRGKRFFEEEVMKSGIYHEPRISEDEAKKIAVLKLRRRLRKEGEECVEPLSRMHEVKLLAEFRGLVHYPLWELLYRYRGDNYKGFVDGATGAVILAEYPATMRARTVQLSLSAFFLVFGTLVSLVVSKLTGIPIVPIISGVAASAAAAIAPLRRGTRRKLVASQLRVIRREESETIVRWLRKGLKPGITIRFGGMT